ncbi:hypothetical protein [Streptomyces violascens]|uniref:hypothetical protein n=1 Tax=Streptomyces violascens TaxID=67381 RepID=UPI0036779C76
MNTSHSGDENFLFDFDPRAVAAQILAQAATPLPTQAVRSHPTDRASAAGLLPDTLTDRGNAKLFVRLYANDYRHVPGLGWYRWDTTRWQIDEDDTVLWAAGDLATTDSRGLHSNQALHKHRRRALSTSGINAMLTQAKSAPGMVLNAALLDADPYVLCTPKGIVDLRTGLLRIPDPNKDFHTRSTSTGPEPVNEPLKFTLQNYITGFTRDLPLLFQGWFWLAVSLVLTLRRRWAGPYSRELRLLGASSLLYILAYLPTAPQSNFRYVYWPALAGTVAVVLAVASHAARRHAAADNAAETDTGPAAPPSVQAPSPKAPPPGPHEDSTIPG